jgi:restriction system protein
VTDMSATPEELIAKSFETLSAALESDLLDRVREMSPGFFENLVIGLLVKLGDGGGQPEMGRAIGRSGDGGIARLGPLSQAPNQRDFPEAGRTLA